MERLSDEEIKELQSQGRIQPDCVVDRCENDPNIVQWTRDEHPELIEAFFQSANRQAGGQVVSELPRGIVVPLCKEHVEFFKELIRKEAAALHHNYDDPAVV